MDLYTYFQMYTLILVCLFHSVLSFDAANLAELKGLVAEPLNNFKVNSNLLTPSIDEVKRMAWVAAASVCEDNKLKDWSCKACKSPDVADVTFYKSYPNPRSGVKAYIATSKSKKQIILAYRGGSNFKNALSFLNFFTTPFKPYVDVKGAEVHKGFKEAMETTINPILADLKRLKENKKYEGYKVVVTGHSLGGALATLAILRVKAYLELDWSELELYTYGQLRSGNVKFAKWLSEQKLKMGRGVNYNDLAPHFFYNGFFQTFAHFGTEFWIDDPKKGSYRICDTSYLEDPNCSNSIPPKKLTIDSHLKFFGTDFSVEGAC